MLLTVFVSRACPNGRNLDTFVPSNGPACRLQEERRVGDAAVSLLAQDTPICAFLCEVDKA